MSLRSVFLNGSGKILERLDQTIDVIDNPKKVGKTTDIGTLF